MYFRIDRVIFQISQICFLAGGRRDVAMDKIFFGSYRKEKDLVFLTYGFFDFGQNTGFFIGFLRNLPVSRAVYMRFCSKFVSMISEVGPTPYKILKNIPCGNRSFLPVFLKLSVSRAVYMRFRSNLVVVISEVGSTPP